ncbi:MAG TPA: hypothetical protein VHT53_04965 [Candidatus Elarobacter sp.]|nr:hypothetical protein [Candidatus Elarobacter sp.]
MYGAGVACLAAAALVFSSLAGSCTTDDLARDAAPDAAATAAPSPPVEAAASPSPSPVAASGPVAIVQPTAPPKPAYGDLTHLTYTATGALRAAFVAPADGSPQLTPAIRVMLSTVPGGGVELRVNGDVVPPSNIGSRSVDPATGDTRYEFFGVKLDPGPNTVTVVPLGAGGARGTAVTETLFGPGKAVRVSAHVDGALVADGKSAALLRIAAFDAWGHPALPGSIVKVSLTSGDATLGIPSDAKTAAAPPAPAARRTDEVALQPGGTTAVPIVPGLLPNPLSLHVAIGDVADDVTVPVRAALRKTFIAGLASAGVGAMPGTVDGDGLEDGGGSRRGRLAVFGTGALRGDAVTFAYESANRLAPSSVTGPFVDDPTEAPYENPGDSSLAREDVRSRDHLYLRVDSPRSTFTWGEFQAQTGSGDGLGGYAQTLSGAHLAIRAIDRAPGLSLFTAKNDVAYARRVFPATGLATLAGTLDPDIVVGSETVILASLDRRTGAIATQTPLTRDVDYIIDYASGSLQFLSLPLPYDAHFNPQAIVIQYQYAGAHVRSQTTGGRAEIPFGGGTKLGIGYVNDATGTGNYSLFQQDLSGAGNGWRWTLAHAASRGDVGTVADGGAALGSAGDALRGAVAFARGPFHLAAEYDSTSAGFANPFGGLSTPGLQNYRLAASRIVPERSELTFEVDGQRNAGTLGDDAQRSAALRWRRIVSKRFSFGAGLEARSHTATSEASAGDTVQADLSSDYKIGNRGAISISRISTVRGSEDLSQPSQTSAQMSFDLPHAGKAYVRELWSAAPTLSFANASAGLTGSAQATRSMMVGIAQPLSGNTSVDSQYVLDRTATGTTAYGVMGLHERLELSSRLRAEAFAQDAAGGTGGFAVGGLQLAYANGTGVRAAASVQTRGGASAGTTASLRASGQLSSEVSLLADVQMSRTTVTSTGDAQIGFAVRPTDNDRHVTLLSFDRHLGTLENGTDRADVVSLDHLFRPDPRTELSMRFAYKIDGDGYYAARTSLIDFRAIRKLTRRFDIGAEARTLDAAGIGGARSTALATETGYRLSDAVRIAVGRTFSATADPSLTGQPVHRGFYVTVTSLVDRLFRDQKH